MRRGVKKEKKERMKSKKKIRNRKRKRWGEIEGGRREKET